MFCLGVMCFGVYAATTVQYSLSGNINYELNDVFVDIDTSLYGSTDDDLASSQLSVAENLRAISTALESNQSVNSAMLDKFSYTDHQTSLGVVGNNDFQTASTPMTLNYGSYIQNQKSYVYYIAITISNYANEYINAILNLDSLYELNNSNIVIAPERTMETINPGTSDSPQKLCFVFALILNNPSQSVSLTFDNVLLTVSRGELKATEGLEFTLTDDGNAYSVSSGTATGDKIIIPSHYQGKEVTTISKIGGGWTGGWGNLPANWKEVYIPNTITTVKDYGLGGMPNLRYLYIPQSIQSIGDSFAGGLTSLVTLYIPENISIDYDINNDIHYSYYPFYSTVDLAYNSSVMSIYVSAENPTYASQDGILFTKDKTGLIYFASKIMAHYSIPDGVTHIRDNAFYSSNLQSITFPESLLEIGSNNFNSLSNLTQLDLPEGLLEIGSNSFRNLTNLTQLDLPEGLLEIGSSSFYNLPNINSIALPDSLTTLMGAFINCENLQNVTLGNNITDIDSSAFSGSPWIKQYQAEVNSYGIVAVADLKEKMGIVASRDGSVKYCFGIPGMTIVQGNGLTYCDANVIARYAFRGVTFNIPQYIPSTVNIICKDAFSSCKFPNKVYYIDSTTTTSWHLTSYGPSISNPEVDLSGDISSYLTVGYYRLEKIA